MSHQPPLSTGGHRRRTSQSSPASAEKGLWSSRTSSSEYHLSGADEPHHSTLSPIPDADSRAGTPPGSMSLTAQGLGIRASSPADGILNGRTSPSSSVSWQNAKARSNRIRGINQNDQGGFSPTRVLRNLSWSLPRFTTGADGSYAEKEKLGRGRIPQTWNERARNIAAFLWRCIWRLRLQLLMLAGIILLIVLYYQTPAHKYYRRTSWLGGGNKFVVILAANVGGGVMEWKGPREWAIERDSVRNKKRYVARHGYDLEIVDMATKKRYAHEWRESWEKVDTIKRCLREYPEAEWFWWLDLNTFIMEPTYSLQSHIFNDLEKNTYRDINLWNPLNITHPPVADYLDATTMALNGDEDPDSINMVIPQDCSGFNLGSFFMRRSSWTERVLDIWWDPVMYEQRHMQWEHKEQDAFEYLYESQPWIRSSVAFAPQRKICSFPQGACGENNASIHYTEKDRDFVVNMAGCEWGRDCWGEMYQFRELSNKLNRTLWEKFKDGISDMFKAIVRRFKGEEEKKD